MNIKRAVLIVVALLTLLLAGGLILGQSTAQNTKVTFSAADRKTIDSYYTHLYGTLAPGSLDRKDFPEEIEKALKPGGKVPIQLEKDLAWLPEDLESKLSQPPGGYVHYKLGHHILIVRRSDLTIADIIKDAGLK
jgi:hypothetical protein